MKPALFLSKEDFTFFQELLIQETGIYFEEERSGSLLLALESRLKETDCSSYRQYYGLLKSYPVGNLEMRNLLDLLTTTETYFFRNSEQFDVLIADVLPRIIREKMNSADKSIRVWSAGCSRGNEAYSIAIAIMEVFSSYENWYISILGTDVNRPALFSAQDAVYGQHDMGHLSKEYQSKYFVRDGSNYILNDNVKKMVKFEYHNLAKDPFTMEAMQNLDIIFCRNVTIYFDFETTRQVINNFADCLLPGGLLFLGHAETLWQISDKFESVQYPNTFLYKKSFHPAEEESIKPFIHLPSIDFESTILSAPITPQEQMPHIIEEEAEKVSEGYIRAHLSNAYILADQGKYTDAVNTVAEVIKADNLSIEAYYLLGVILYRTDDLKEAQAQFRKVIYIDPDIIMAYFNLANIYLHQKEYSKASFEFQNVVKLLAKKEKEEKIRFHEDFTADFLLRTCKRYLEIIAVKERGG